MAKRAKAVAKRSRAVPQLAAPKVQATKPAALKLPKVASSELVTLLDFVRYAVSRFVGAKLVFAHGTTDPVAEAAFLVGEALHLPPERFDAFSRARVTGAERTAILRLIAARGRSRKPAAYLWRRAYIQGVPFYVDERVIVPRSYLGELLAGELFAQGDYSLVDPGKVTRVLDLCTG